MMDVKLAKIYYSPGGYWKGIAAIKKLSEAAKVPEETAKKWLFKQTLWQIFLSAPKRIPRPKYDVPTPNKVYQADLLFLPHDKLPRGRKVFKYALTVVDVASRYKEAEPLTSKNSDEVALAFKRIYKRAPLKWPQLLQVDPGREFMGAVTKEMENHKTYIRRGRVDIHRDQAIVERFNRTLAERLFGYQYAIEMRMPEGQRSTAWVKKASRSCGRSEQRSNKPYRPETRGCHQRKKCFCKAIDTLFEACWRKGKKSSPLL